MPPKVRITKNEIIKASLDIVRKNGEQAMKARSIAAMLDCSTQPVFSNFATMEELQEAVSAAAYEYYLGFLEREAASGKYPPYKAFGMAYIRFAEEEKELFKFLFMRERKGNASPNAPDFEASVEVIMKATGVKRETAILMHLEMWIYVHGIATILATSFLDLDWDLISQLLSDMYQGMLAKHLREEK